MTQKSTGSRPPKRHKEFVFFVGAGLHIPPTPPEVTTLLPARNEGNNFLGRRRGFILNKESRYLQAPKFFFRRLSEIALRGSIYIMNRLHLALDRSATMILW